jgi:leucyl/phenylalanyl-tRNA--protein transferase
MSNREITPQLLLQAYAAGLFPMAENTESDELFWIDAPMRGILPLDTFHVPRRLARTVRKGLYRITVNRCFTDVITACAGTPRENQKSSWINASIRKLYTSLHTMGHAHSVEAWRDDKLVGGLYGVSLGRAFFGESMFSTARDASKVALVHLVARLVRQGFILLDAQFINDHLMQFGIKEIPRADYHGFLRLALSGSPAFFAAGAGEEDGAGLVSTFLQSRIQTS